MRLWNNYLCLATKNLVPQLIRIHTKYIWQCFKKSYEALICQVNQPIGGYARTRTRTRTHTILKYTFAFIQQFIPTAVDNAVFASKPRRRSYFSFNPFISTCAVKRQYATWHPMPSSVVQVLQKLFQSHSNSFGQVSSF